jgi:hypothetical protein
LFAEESLGRRHLLDWTSSGDMPNARVTVQLWGAPTRNAQDRGTVRPGCNEPVAFWRNGHSLGQKPKARRWYWEGLFGGQN